MYIYLFSPIHLFSHLDSWIFVSLFELQCHLSLFILPELLRVLAMGSYFRFYFYGLCFHIVSRNICLIQGYKGFFPVFSSFINPFLSTFSTHILFSLENKIVITVISFMCFATIAQILSVYDIFIYINNTYSLILFTFMRHSVFYYSYLWYN